MAVRGASTSGSAAVQGNLLRSLTVLSRAQFRHAPAPAAFARSEPLSGFNSSVLLTPAGGNSLLLDNARCMSQRRHSSEKIRKDVEAITATYEMLLQRLYQVNRFSAVKLGLENMQQLHAAFGDPASTYQIIHVAGTNGKGSVAFKLAKALERSGHKTGLFVSPHVACFRERVQVNGTFISESDVCETLTEIFNVSAQMRIPATFFELTTMLAFRYFAKQNVDYVVLETGLGGRLDSTNIVTPVLSVITSIGMDHVRLLGPTREAIAREKAGIMKPSVPVVVGPNTPVNVMVEYAARNNARLVRVPLGTDFETDYNVENTAIAREACVQLNARYALQSRDTHLDVCVDLTDQRVNAALESRPPCRFQVLHVMRPNSKERKVTVVLDVAHNPQAIDRLASLLHKKFPDKKFRFVCGFSADKAIAEVLDKMKAIVRSSYSDETEEQLHERIHLVKANHPRGASLEEINLAVANASIESGKKHAYATISSIKEGVEIALHASRASTDDEVVVICGSVFLMAEARQALGIKEPVDSFSLNAVAGSHLSTPESCLTAAKQEVAAAT